MRRGLGEVEEGRKGDEGEMPSKVRNTEENPPLQNSIYEIFQ